MTTILRSAMSPTGTALVHAIIRAALAVVGF